MIDSLFSGLIQEIGTNSYLRDKYLNTLSSAPRPLIAYIFMLVLV
jgi:hypothetical protein